MRHPPTFAAVTVVALLLTGCGSDGEGTCGPVRREALDPGFLVHVVGDAEVEYSSDPPTCGPHQAAPPVTGVVDDPLPRPIQVGILERGDVLLQHRPDLPEDQRRALEDLVADGVVVAPNPDLPDPVVATAWLYKRTCSAVDTGALSDFVDERLGKGPEG